MRRALELADRAAASDEVPVGAVLVRDEKIIGEGWNSVISSADPSAHAEVLALRDAANRVDNYRLPGSTLYVTLEPCTMCAGLLIHARVAHLVFATREPKAGVICSNDAILEAAYLNHRVSWSEGLCSEESSQRLQAFFHARRR